jgi:hypothetical protein
MLVPVGTAMARFILVRNASIDNLNSACAWAKTNRYSAILKDLNLTPAPAHDEPVNRSTDRP